MPIPTTPNAGPSQPAAASPAARIQAAHGASAVRRWPVGAEYQSGGRTHFRAWAPAVRAVAVVFDDGRRESLDTEDGGYFSGLIDAAPGSRYQFQLGSGVRPYPDPAS